MEFRIADTFTDSLARLGGDEQKAVKTTAFDLQVNPAHPSLQFHKLDRPKDPNFASVRVSKNIRIIVHRTGTSLLLCYVDHHDKAYQWAERRRIETHPRTGAAQLVEVRETVKEITVPKYVEAQAPPVDSAPATTAPATPAPPLFATLSDDELLGYGVPPNGWATCAGQRRNRCWPWPTISLPRPRKPCWSWRPAGRRRGWPRLPKAPTPSPIRTPSAASAWCTMWKSSNAPSIIRGRSGRCSCIRRRSSSCAASSTGRRAWPARREPARRSSRCTGPPGWHAVIPTPVSDTLARALHTRLRRLLGSEPRLAERIDVQALDAVAARLHRAHFGEARIATRDEVRMAVREAAAAVGGHRFGPHFLLTEWEQVVDAWQLATWEAYRDVARLGRKTRLPEAQRRVLWSIFERVRAALVRQGTITKAQMFTALAGTIAKAAHKPFDHAVVDEAQDLGVAQLRFLAALGARRPNALFLAGDLGQRIFQQPFSWKALGVDIRGRSRTLRVNYRTSHQIRSQADRLLGPALTDLDGNEEDRRHTVSVFNGPPPTIVIARNEAEEAKAVAEWIAGRIKQGLLPHELGVFVRSDAQLDRAVAAVERAGPTPRLLDEHVETASGQISVATMHLAKGLEFRAVAVMACDDEVIPLQERIETVGDDADLGEVYETERHLLYVACTRARDHLLVTGVAPASEFIEDLDDRKRK